MSKRLNQEMRESTLLMAEGIIGEINLSKKLKILLGDDYEIENDEINSTAFHDLSITNKKNSKKFLIESEKYTSDSNEKIPWNKKTELMFSVEYERYWERPPWPDGLNIVSRKIIELKEGTHIPKINKEGRYVFKNINNKKPYDLFIKTSPDCKYFFAIRFETLKEMVQTETLKLKINHKNSKNKVSNTNDIFPINGELAYKLIKNKKLLLDDWNKLVIGIKAYLK